MVNQYLNILHKLPLNWSSISSFEYDKEQWFRQYILGYKSISKEMTFGSMVDKRIQTDPNFLPSMPRYEFMQMKFENVKLGKLILKGTPDGVNLTKCYALADYKTGKKPWDQKRADGHGQLTMYLLFLYLTKGLKPELFDLYIHWMPTEEDENFNIRFVKEDDIKTFKTKRTMRDLLKFINKINTIYKKMELYCKNKA